MSNANIYRDILLNLLKEDSVAGAGGALGDAAPIYSPDSINNTDSYAPGDARNIFGKKMKFPIQKRNIINKLSSKQKKKLKKS